MRRELSKQRREPPSEPSVRPLGWIITAQRPASVLARLPATQATDWPRGVYFSASPGPIPLGLEGAGGMLRVGIVVASELPRDRSTLLVRFLAAGPLLADAIAELGALEEGAHERSVAEEILVELRDVLGKKSSPTPQETEFIVSMQSTWAKAREEGRTEGEAAARVRDVLAVLRVRGIAVSDAARERILAERDPARLERWHERAILAASVAEVIDDPS